MKQLRHPVIFPRISFTHSIRYLFLLAGAILIFSLRAHAQELQETDQTASAAAVTESSVTNPEADDHILDLPLAPSTDNPCQIIMTADLPEHFTHSVEVTLRNLTLNRNYRLILTAPNGYTATGYAPTGDYAVTEILVPTDVQGYYAFLYPMDFTLDAPDEIAELTTTLANYTEVEAEIQRKLASSGGTMKDSAEPDFVSLGPTEEDKEQKPDSDYEVTADSEGGMLGITGDPNGCYRIRIEVTSGTLPGNLSIRYVLHPTDIWTEAEVPLSGRISLSETDAYGRQKDSGLTAVFLAKEGLTFHSGDTFTTFVQAPENEVLIDHQGDGGAELSVKTLTGDPDTFLPLYDSGVRPVVEILKTGGFSDAVVRLSTDGGKTFGEQTVIPDNGILPIPEAGIALCFSGNDNRILFHENDRYSVRAEKKNLLQRAVIAALLILLSALLLFTMFSRHMKSLIPGDEVYHIHPVYPDAAIDRRKKGSRSRSSRYERKRGQH